MRSLLVLLPAALLLIAVSAEGSSLRFYGYGDGMVDRVKIPVDDPFDPNDEPGPPVDVGAGDFTLEFFLRGLASENTSVGVPCGTAEGWIYGNIVFDRDRWEPGGRDWGVSLSDRRITFGVTNAASQSNTVCGATPILDGDWHHVAVQRRASDGVLQIWIDGMLDGTDWGPLGDVSYPGNEVPTGSNCEGGPCFESDPFLVIGAEKHDAGPAFPSFSGWIDEVRLSDTLRYTAPFAPPTAPFSPDAATRALYHLDEGAGDVITDASGAPGGPSPGERRFGGSPVPGPVWSADTPFPATGAPRLGLPDGWVFEAWPNPARGEVVLFARVGEGQAGPAHVDIVDVAGRRVANVSGRLDAGSGMWVWDGRAAEGGRAPGGVYFARLEVGERTIAARFVRR